MAGELVGDAHGLGGVVFDDDLSLMRAVDGGVGELDALVLAYATTIHKAQGSKYPAVVIPVTTQHWPMLMRNLLSHRQRHRRSCPTFLGGGSPVLMT